MEKQEHGGRRLGRAGGGTNRDLLEKSLHSELASALWARWETALEARPRPSSPKWDSTAPGEGDETRGYKRKALDTDICLPFLIVFNFSSVCSIME